MEWFFSGLWIIALECYIHNSFKGTEKVSEVWVYSQAKICWSRNFTPIYFLSRHQKCHELCIQPWNVVRYIIESHILCIFKCFQCSYFTSFEPDFSSSMTFVHSENQVQNVLKGNWKLFGNLWFIALTYCVSCQKNLNSLKTPGTSFTVLLRSHSFYFLGALMFLQVLFNFHIMYFKIIFMECP